MLDIELRTKIIDGTCTRKELKNFTEHFNKCDFDLDNPFKKFYNLEKILNVIEKKKNNKISSSYYSMWNYAYKLIISFGDNFAYSEIEYFIVNEIKHLLSSISYDTKYNKKLLNHFAGKFIFLDSILNNSTKWKYFYYEERRLDYVNWCNGNYCLFINDEEKTFGLINSFHDIEDDSDFKFYKLCHLKEMVRVLNRNHYKNLKFSKFNN